MSGRTRIKIVQDNQAVEMLLSEDDNPGPASTYHGRWVMWPQNTTRTKYFILPPSSDKDFETLRYSLLPGHLSIGMQENIIGGGLAFGETKGEFRSVLFLFNPVRL